MAIPSSASLLPVVGKALLLSSGLLVLLFRYLMGNLHIEAIEMHHMDPTDIVLVPFDLHRLVNFVALVTGLGVLDLLLLQRLPASKLFSLLAHWVQATLGFWVIALVCGTPPTREVYHTLGACAYLATLTVVLPQAPPVTATATWWQARLALPPLHAKRKPSINHHGFSAQLLATFQVHATLFVTVPFQVLRLYDWGSQIQRWPLPMVLGSTYGFCAGSLLGSVAVGALNCSPPLRAWYEEWTAQSRLENNHNNNNTHQD